METHILIKNVSVVDTGGSFNGKKIDLRIKKGVITEIGTDLEHKSALVLDKKGSYISPGWMDGQAHFRDPGLELKEGLERGLHACAAGGFTDVAVLPSTPLWTINRRSLIFSRVRQNTTSHVTHTHLDVSQKGGKENNSLNFMT
jgi:dihydroorotase-like cyclic amidohydrolase